MYSNIYIYIYSHRSTLKTFVAHDTNMIIGDSAPQKFRRRCSRNQTTPKRSFRFCLATVPASWLVLVNFYFTNRKNQLGKKCIQYIYICLYCFACFFLWCSCDASPLKNLVGTLFRIHPVPLIEVVICPRTVWAQSLTTKYLFFNHGCHSLIKRRDLNI